jgi:hypothetical protein
MTNAAQTQAPTQTQTAQAAAQSAQINQAQVNPQTVTLSMLEIPVGYVAIIGDNKMPLGTMNAAELATLRANAATATAIINAPKPAPTFWEKSWVKASILGVTGLVCGGAGFAVGRSDLFGSSDATTVEAN